MSGFPAFNISKSTPTTSTTNVSGNSTPSVAIGSSSTAHSDPNGSGSSGSVSGSPFIKQILSKGQATTDQHTSPSTSNPNTNSNSSPSFGPMNPVAVSSVSPTLATPGLDESHSKATSGKPDLIGLFDKFDINKTEGKHMDDTLEEPSESLNEKETKDEKVENPEPTDDKDEDKDDTQEIEDSEEQTTEKQTEEITPLDTNKKLAESSSKEIASDSPIASPAENVEGEVQSDEKDKLKTSGNQNEETLIEFDEKKIDDDNTEAISAEPEASNSQSLEELEHQRRIDAALGNFTEDQEFEEPSESYTQDIENEIADEQSADATEIPDAEDIHHPAPIEGEESEAQPESKGVEEKEQGTTATDADADEYAAAPFTGQDSKTVSRPAPKRTLSNVDPVEQHQQSHKPFDFQNFLLQLKKKNADPIVRYIRSFLVSFSRQAHTFTYKQKIKIIVDFKVFINEKFSLYEPFASMDDIDLENSREGLEKLIMNRLYDYCFPPAIRESSSSTPQTVKDLESDLKQDQKFSNQVEKFSWVNGAHLDVDLTDLQKGNNGLNFIEYAVLELNKINNFRAPRDKIICVLNSCKIIFGFLKVSKQETNADSFVPILILVILKAKTPNLVSNMHYIEHYRAEEWLSHGETSYYLSSLQGAIGFIQNLGLDDLTISEAEYSAHMEAWDAQQKQIARERKEQQEKVKAEEIERLNARTGSASSQSGPISIQHPQPQRSTEQNQPQVSLSPSTVLFNSAEIVSKSIANFLSPSPQPEAHSIEDQSVHPHPPPAPIPVAQFQPTPTIADTPATKEAFESLVQMFPNIDKGILQDLVYIKNGNIDECVDTCLELAAGE